MKTITIEQATLDDCLEQAQRERIVITRNGVPVALIVGLEGMDAEQAELSRSEPFWAMIAERRRQEAVSRSALEQEVARQSGVEAD